MEKQEKPTSNLYPTVNRLSTGVQGLDDLLKGGFLEGGMYLLLGPPGSGKTILGNQICFHHTQQGRGNVVYVTLLAESHSRMMSNLRGLEYFQDDLVARSIHYMSGYRALETNGLKGLLVRIAGMVRDHKATLLMIDGITTIGDMGQSSLAFRKFTHEMNTYIATSGCTAFLLSSMEGNQSNPEHTMVDGIIALHHECVGLRAIREIEVRKFRGSNHFGGKHLLKISEGGVRVYPRAESLRVPSHRLPNIKERVPFGVAGLDEMLGGGVIGNSITTLIGHAGTGKTILGLRFLREGAVKGERGLFFGFYEHPNDLIDKSEQLGFDLRRLIENGSLVFQWHPPLESELDELGAEIVDSIKRTNAKRVVIDGVDGFRHSASVKERVNCFLTALVLRLKAMGVTLLLIEETSLFHNHTERQIAEFSAVNENLIYLRHIDIGEGLIRVVSIIKIRNAIYDCALRELKISNNGIEVLGVIRSPEGILSHQPRFLKSTESKKRSRLTSRRKP